MVNATGQGAEHAGWSLGNASRLYISGSLLHAWSSCGAMNLCIKIFCFSGRVCQVIVH
jgi:hypothetical protein